MRILLTTALLWVLTIGAIHAQDLQSLGDSAYEKGNYYEAAGFYRQWLEKSPHSFVPYDSIKVPDVQYALALALTELGDYAKADSLLRQMIALYAGATADADLRYARCMEQLGYIDLVQGNYDEGEKKLRTAMAIQQSSGKASTTDMAETFASMGYLYTDLGELDSAVYYYQRAIAGFEKDPDAAISYGDAICSMGELYFVSGRFNEAITAFKTTFDVVAAKAGTAHPSCDGALNNLAVTYKTIGLYSEAEPMYLKVIENYSNSLGAHHPYYAKALNNLAQLYTSTAAYDKAEPLILQAVAIMTENFGEVHKESASMISNLALLYHSMGNYEKAEGLYKKSLEIRKELFGEVNYDYTISLSNLAQLYTYMHRWDESEQLLKKLIVIRKELFGEDHEQYAMAIHSLGLCYFYCDRYDDALPLIKRSLEIRMNNFGEVHPLTAQSLEAIGVIAMNRGQFQVAEDTLIKELRITEKVYGRGHPEFLVGLNNLGKCYEMSGQIEKAGRCFTEANALSAAKLKQSGWYLNEKERALFLSRNLSSDLAYQWSYFCEHASGNDSLAAQIYDNALLYKGVLLSSSLALKNNILSGSDTLSQRIYGQYQLVVQSLSRMYSLQSSQQWLDVDSLEQTAEKLQKELLLRASLDISAGDFAIGWQDVKAKLKPHEAAIEWIRFRYCPAGRVSESVIYCAIVLRADADSPEVFMMFTEDRLHAVMNTGSGQVQQNITALYSHPQRGIRLGAGTAAMQGDSLYALLWKPLEGAMKGIRRVYLSPTGLVARVAFDAVPSPDGKLLSDRYDIRYLGSTARLTNETALLAQNLAADEMMLLGGIDYDARADQLRTALEQFAPGSESLPLSRSASPGDTNLACWSFLPATVTEIDGISDLMESLHYRVRKLSGSNASEDILKRAIGKASPGVLHIASHGFFFPDNDSTRQHFDPTGNIQYVQSADPLMRSGLVLAGGNAGWQGQPQHEHMEDGILTAYEVAQLNFTNTKLLVLSACETGLGETLDNEGVFGLQRGFRMAGIPCMIYSLWQVPDQETQMMMQEFYRQWLGGKEIHAAFKGAQEYMKKQCVDRIDAWYYWAGFVLME